MSLGTGRQSLPGSLGDAWPSIDDSDDSSEVGFPLADIRRSVMTIEVLLIWMLLSFTAGLIVGVLLARPHYIR